MGIGEWGDDDLIVDVERPTPAAALVVNDWFWGGGPPDATVIPWTWLQMPIALRADQPINSAAITRVNQAAASSNNTTSQATYGVFAVAAQLDTISPDDAANFAQFLTTYYANPLLRAPTFTLSLVHRTDEERWKILGREIGDRFTLGPATVQDYPGHTTVLPVPAGLPAGARSLVIEGIHHTSSVTDRVVEWTTAPLLGNTTSAGLSLPGATGSYASTPDTAVLDIVGDIDLRADVTMAYWTPAAIQTFVAKVLAPNDRSYWLRLDTSGLLNLLTSTNGTAFQINVLSTVAPIPNAAGRLAVRATLKVDNGAAGNTVTFYTAPTIAGPWTQLGAPVVSAGVTSIFSSAAILEVGTAGAGTISPMTGVVHAAEVRNGIDGSVVANPNFGAQTPGATVFVDAAGLTWTVNGTGQIVALRITSGPWFRLGVSVLGSTDAVPF